LKLLVTRNLPDRVMSALDGQFDCDFREGATPLDETAARDALQTYDAILPTLGDQLGAGAFPEAPRCRLLANFGVGVNHIDVAAATAAGVAVTNTPGAVTDATADVAMMLMLMAARRASEGEAMVRAGRWTGWQPTQLLGLHLTGKTVGIIGMGRIGQAIAKRAHHGFGMRVLYHNRSPKGPLGFDATQLDLDAVLAQSDVVVMAVPATIQTRHMVGATELGKMQPHAILVNIARGDVVDEQALIDALKAQKIAGAGLDVYEFEPTVPEALRALKSVTLLPHLGTAALEVREAMGMMAVDNLIAFAQGKPLPNPVRI